MKKNENYGFVLSVKENGDKKSARIVGANHFQLVDFELNQDADVKVHEKIFIGNGSEGKKLYERIANISDKSDRK